MRNRRFKLPDELLVIAADNVEHYRRTMKRVQIVAENAAPELFKWLAWSVAIAALEVVRQRTGATLLWLNIILFGAILGRVQYKINLLEMTEAIQPDGSLRLKPGSLWQTWARVIATLLCWAITAYIAFVLPRVIAHSDLLPAVNVTTTR